MVKRSALPFVSSLFKKAAKRAGVTLTIEPRWGYAGQIVSKSGKKRYYRNTRFDINTLGASEIAADKDYAKYFMREMGYPVAGGDAFYSPAWCKALGSKNGIDAAYRYATRRGFPVIVKPNSKSQGVGVLQAHTKAQFYRAFRKAAAIDNVVLVEEVLVGRDYRVVVLDGEVISAYERLPLSVLGDGHSSIKTLLERKRRKFVADERTANIRADDWRIKEKLTQSGRRLSSIPARGEQVVLLDNANLSSGGESVDVLMSIHPGFKKIAARLTQDMGLRFCGVDLMVDGDITQKPDRYWVLEVNAAPGLDHYASSGAKQKKIVEDLYAKLLRSMAK